MANSHNSEVIMFSSIPKPNDLCYFKAEINESEKQTTNICSKFQRQNLKCRLLIFSEKELIASPILGDVKYLHIITSRDFYISGKLQKLLSFNDIKGNEPESVPNEIYESCLHYSLIARISPSWNFVEPYLIQGQNFLAETGAMNAVKVQIIINGDDAHIVIWPQQVKLPQVSLKDFLIHQKKNLSINDEEDFNYDFSQDNEKVYVLPRMKRGKIEAISRKIPKDSPFLSYLDFQKYWKNNHGYKLPESSDDVYYFSVRFNEENPLMIYPNLCVRSTNLMVQPRASYETILEAFSCDLKAKFSNICGKPFGANSQMGYAVSKLNSSTEIFMYPNWVPAKQVRRIQDDSDIQSFKDDLIENGKTFEAGDSSDQACAIYPKVKGLHFTDAKLTLKKSNSYTKLGDNKDNNLSKDKTETTKPKLDMPQVQSNEEKNETSSTPVEVKNKSEESENNINQAFKDGNSLLDNTDKETSYKLKIPKLTINQQITLIPTTKNSSALNLFPPSLPVEFLAPVTINENQIGIKRPGQPVFLMPTPPKKPRSKPHVQEDIDVEEYAKKGLLANANVVTLQHYLRKNSVACKVKDKKSELITKILNFLKLPTENSQN